MIETRGLSKSFGPVPVVSGLDLHVPAGAALCLLGPNGAGKTTVVRMLAMLRPDSGWARIAGLDVVSDGSAVRREIGLSGQYASVDECMTGRANLVMIGELSRLPRRQARQRAAELLAQFDLEHAANRAVRTYSGGMRRRLDLAASLIGEPSVLFLDEPTTGLDPRSRLVMWDIIRALLVEHGVTVLLTTQYLEEADRLADRIAVIDHGRVTAEGTPAELKASVRGDYLEVAASAGADRGQAMAVLARHACGPVRWSARQGCFEVPVLPRAGLVTDFVRDLDAAGIAVDDITLRRPSLDEVFLALTGRPGRPESEQPAAAGAGCPDESRSEERAA